MHNRAGSPILLDASPLDNGHATRGIGRYAAGVIRGMDENGYRDFATIRQRAIVDSRALLPSKPWPACNVPWRQALRLQFALPELLKKSGAKLLHLLDPLPLPAPRRGLVLTATVLDLIPLLIPEHHVRWGDEWGLARLHYHRVFLNRLKQADALVAISGAVRDDLVNHLGIPSERIRVIHLGAEEATLGAGPVTDQEQIMLDECAQAPYFIFSGAAEKRKNLERVIEALAGTDLPHRLVMAGRPGLSNVKRLQEKASELGCLDRIKFTGFVSDQALSALYRGAEALVFPSIAEGFGLPLLEAMRENCPVLTSRGQCLEEVAGNAALLVDPTSVSEIRAGLMRLAGDQELRSQLRVAGDLRWREFTWKRCARELQEFWNDLL